MRAAKRRNLADYVVAAGPDSDYEPDESEQEEAEEEGEEEEEFEERPRSRARRGGQQQQEQEQGKGSSRWAARRERGSSRASRVPGWVTTSPDDDPGLATSRPLLCPQRRRDRAATARKALESRGVRRSVPALHRPAAQGQR